MRRAPVFEEENALPGSQLHSSIDNGHCFTGARQNHADVRWHVVAAFGSVCEVAWILGHEPIKEFFQITSRGRIGIFHDDHAATGMLDKHRRRPVPDAASIDL